MEKEQKLFIAKETSIETFNPEIDKMIEGAKQAVQYFKWLQDSQKATAQLIEHQLKYAEEQLENLQLEKNLKYGESSN